MNQLWKLCEISYINCITLVMDPFVLQQCKNCRFPKLEEKKKSVYHIQATRASPPLITFRHATCLTKTSRMVGLQGSYDLSWNPWKLLLSFHYNNIDPSGNIIWCVSPWLSPPLLLGKTIFILGEKEVWRQINGSYVSPHVHVVKWKFQAPWSHWSHGVNHLSCYLQISDSSV